MLWRAKFKSAKWPGSGPAAQDHKQPSTRLFASRGCPLLSGRYRRSVPQCAPRIDWPPSVLVEKVVTAAEGNLCAVPLDALHMGFA
jgi:hypothetical protein